MQVVRLRLDQGRRALGPLSMIALVLFTVTSPALANDVDRLTARLQSRLDRLQGEQRFPGATAAVRLTDGTVIALATGLADLEENRPMTLDTRILSGSVGKTFVAAVALQLVNEGRLELDATIDRYLDSESWFDRLAGGDEITLRQLLSHRSGLPDHVYDPRYAAASRKVRGQGQGDPNVHFAPRKLVQFILDRELLFAPDTGYAYTDTGYILVGLIIESVADQTYYEELTDRFLKPLELKLTTPSTGRRFPGLASGYVGPDNRFGLPRKVAENETMRFSPASEWTGGGLVTNPQDLVQWGHALYAGEALSESMREELLGSAEHIASSKDDPTRRDSPNQYGLGSYIYDTPHGKAYGHGGWYPGFRTILSYYPGHGFAVAMQANTDVNDPLPDPTDTATAASDRSTVHVDLIVARNALIRTLLDSD